MINKDVATLIERAKDPHAREKDSLIVALADSLASLQAELVARRAAIKVAREAKR